MGSGLARKPISWRLGVTIWYECAGRCHYCDSPLTPEIAEIDHFVPVCKGGETKLGNLVLACSPCNRWKGTRNGIAVIGDLRATPPIWAEYWPDRWDWERNVCLG